MNELIEKESKEKKRLYERTIKTQSKRILNVWKREIFINFKSLTNAFQNSKDVSKGLGFNVSTMNKKFRNFLINSQIFVSIGIRGTVPNICTRSE